MFILNHKRSSRLSRTIEEISYDVFSRHTNCNVMTLNHFTQLFISTHAITGGTIELNIYLKTKV